ncbi:MAG TPA: hypothetical protein PKB13_02715 [Clostridia bacterium]|nr:hypothetical protein [Clostridia bacterium]
MTLENRIRSALLTFGDPVQVEPFVPEDGNQYPPRYYTFRISTRGANSADNAPQHELAYVLVHFICPTSWDSVTRVEQTKKALFAAGTTWPNKEDASDTNGQDIIFECQIATGVDAHG